MSLGNALPPPSNYEVLYTMHGQPTRAIFLTKDRALDYIAKYSLSDAKLLRCWNEDQIEFNNTGKYAVKELLSESTSSN